MPKRVFEHHKTILKMPAVERTIIEGNNVLGEIVNLEHGFVITSWSLTLQSMGHKSTKALIDRLHELNFKEVI